MPRWWSEMGLRRGRRRRARGGGRRRRCSSGWAPVGGGVPLSSLAVADPELVAVSPPRGCCCSNGGREAQRAHRFYPTHREKDAAMVVGDGCNVVVGGEGLVAAAMKAVLSGRAPVGGGVPLSSTAVADPELVAVSPPRGASLL
ncbi:hypothetical protein Dimus_014091 [Dionaea muscipula]